MAKNKITVKPLISFMSKGSWRGSKKKSKWLYYRSCGIGLLDPAYCYFEQCLRQLSNRGKTLQFTENDERPTLSHPRNNSIERRRRTEDIKLGCAAHRIGLPTAKSGNHDQLNAFRLQYIRLLPATGKKIRLDQRTRSISSRSCSRKSSSWSWYFNRFFYSPTFIQKNCPEG